MVWCSKLKTLLQVHSFSNRSNEHSLRVTSLDHLGVIAARLRRDAADSVEQEHEELVSILAQVCPSTTQPCVSDVRYLCW